MDPGSAHRDEAPGDPYGPDPRTSLPDPTRPDPTRPDPTRPDPTLPDPTLPDPPPARATRTRAGAQALLTLPALGFFLPVLGPWLSLLAVWAGVRPAGAVLWDGRARHPRALVLLGCAALWWPAVLAFVFLSSFGDQLGSPETGQGLRAVSDAVDAVGITFWLFLPLAAPQDWVSPAVAAFVVVLLGAGASAGVRRPWPWLVGAAAAPLAYALVVAVLRIPFLS